MDNISKFFKAINILKPNVELSFFGEITSESDFNKIDWKTGEDSNGIAITTKTNPHSEITWAKFKTEYDKL
tara:strand:+ start:204 stop:416 length:213 start_codon:yes stop_codon:yes gene_type:complete